MDKIINFRALCERLQIDYNKAYNNRLNDIEKKALKIALEKLNNTIKELTE